MADSSNPQYSDPGPMFGGGSYDSTGAPGSVGIPVAGPGEGDGGVIGAPVVSNPYGSSQVAVNMPTASVTAGGTGSNSNNYVVPPAGDPMTGLTNAQVATTGAGLGDGDHFPHPAKNGGAQ